MAFNGSGTFVRLFNWVNDRNNGIKILATRMDAEMDGMATGLTTCITKDGQSTPTANIPMGNFRLTGLGDPTTAQDGVNIRSVQNGTGIYYVDTGTANAYVITPVPSITGYAAGQAFSVKIANTNTLTSTLNVNGFGAVTIKYNDATTNLGAGALPAGTVAEFVHDGTNFQLQNVNSSSATAVTAASTFGTDNRILRSDGTGRGSQSTGITVDDSNNTSGINVLTPSIYSTGATTTLTIASGVVTMTQSYHSIDTQGAASTDDLDTINGGSNGYILIIRSVDGARDVVVRYATGNIILRNAVDFTLASSNDRLVLQYQGGFWFEIGRLESGSTSYFNQLLIGSPTAAASPTAGDINAVRLLKNGVDIGFRGTAQATTSGTSIDFTSIPAGVTRIRIVLNNVSTSGTSHKLIQIGDSGGIENTAYISSFSRQNTGSDVATSTAGYGIYTVAATDTAAVVIEINNVSGDIWIASHSGAYGAGTLVGGGSKTLSATLDRVRLTTANGTDTFDAGSINIFYE